MVLRVQFVGIDMIKRYDLHLTNLNCTRRCRGCGLRSGRNLQSSSSIFFLLQGDAFKMSIQVMSIRSSSYSNIKLSRLIQQNWNSEGQNGYTTHTNCKMRTLKDANRSRLTPESYHLQYLHHRSQIRKNSRMKHVLLMVDFFVRVLYST